MNKALRLLKKFIPKKLFAFFQPIYHWKLALLGALFYRFPSRQIKVVAVTGTKGKTSTVEFLNAILETAGYKTALAGTLRFKIGDQSTPNKYKMTMPGRFFTQKFLRQAVDAKCDYAIIEISSEAAKQYRHKFIELDALLFTNLAKEHIESHGSYEKYVAAKLKIAHALEKSSKSERIIIANIDDKEGQKFLSIAADKKVSYSIENAKPFELSDDGSGFALGLEKIRTQIPGQFNILNMLAAIAYARTQNISDETIKQALEGVREIKGRVQKILIGSDKQDFDVIVDYAHTPDSLRALYETFANKKKICVLGNCGGGRDKWKRKEMAEIADKYCDKIILTDEDPYDDDPREIIDDMAKHIRKEKMEIVMDRREAIRRAIKEANANDVILITGKGTDPYIMRADGLKEPWSDAKVAEGELQKVITDSR
ncbi:MAG: UDP-N-acetylmuramoyl-L-alanyl-D-glutamate--2,6-diaminopimelate ligase [bacterium]